MKLLYRFLYLAQNIYWFLLRPVTLGVRIMMVRGDQIFLVKHSYEDVWSMPGGGLKRGETIEEAARREAREEAGVDLGELTLVGIKTNLRHYKSDHVVLYYCSEFDIRGQENPEIDDTRMFNLDELPENLGESQRRWIQEYLALNVGTAGI